MLALYSVPLALVWFAYAAIRQRHETQSKSVRDAALNAGQSEPVSLHPAINLSRCLGCGACTRVCPEGEVLGLIEGKAQLIEPTSCIGHGACKTACPFDAIELVFGTARRGLDIPHVKPTFETNVPGIFIAGELGGMGLIANAIEQGRQAVASIARLDGLAQSSQSRRDNQDNQGRQQHLDVVIVGSGPAGIAASLAARERGLSYVTLEQDSFGGTVAHYPRGKLVMTRPTKLPLEGKMKFREISKEDLIDYWYGLARRHQLIIHDDERVERIVAQGRGFNIATAKGHSYVARAVLLAIGRRGSPRRLGVPGEELAKVTYRLSDPDCYRGRRVLVVGGGDSALEAAAALAELPGTSVALSYRGDSFMKARAVNRQRVETAWRDGRLHLLMQSTVRAIGAGSVDIEVNGRIARVQNDAVVICAGGTLPSQFLKSIGIKLETKYGTA